MSFISMEPTNQTFQEMMSNGVKYQIPPVTNSKKHKANHFFCITHVLRDL